MLPLFSIAYGQNVWDGGSTTTVTTNGNVGIGSLITNYRLSVSNTVSPSGIYQNTTNTVTGSQYGIYNGSSFSGVSGNKYGLYNSLSTSTSSASYGIYLTNNIQGTGNKMGLYSYVTGSGTGTSYGVYTTIGGSSTMKYGFYSIVANTGTNTSTTDATAYGIYTQGLGANSRAAYFRGDLEVNQGNTIFSGSNGSKTLLLGPSTSGDNTISFVMNQTDNAYDWAYDRSLILKREGEMIKRCDGNGKVFTIERFDLGNDVFRIYGDGKVYATELNVRLASDFPDYVFEKGYELMPLNDVRNYIDQNGHLPNVPSATQIKEEGMDVGEMNRVLLEKVEELTLYLLKQEEEMLKQKEEILKLKQQIESSNGK